MIMILFSIVYCIPRDTNRYKFMIVMFYQINGFQIIIYLGLKRYFFSFLVCRKSNLETAKGENQ